jgi:hypothetical protein
LAEGSTLLPQRCDGLVLCAEQHVDFPVVVMFDKTDVITRSSMNFAEPVGGGWHAAASALQVSGDSRAEQHADRFMLSCLTRQMSSLVYLESLQNRLAEGGILQPQRYKCRVIRAQSSICRAAC